MSMSLVPRGSACSRLSRQILCLPRTQLLIRQHTYSSSPEASEAGSSDVGALVDTGKSTTKKIFTQLPKTLVLEDGKPVEALPLFSGGLKQPQKSRRKRRDVSIG